MRRVTPARPVGIVGPLSGPRAAYGEWLRRAAHGSALPLLWEDDAADPTVAIKAAQRLLDAGAEVVIGHFNSECARAAGRLYQDAGVALLLPAATAPDLCQSVGAFRLCASEERQVLVMADYLNRHSLCIEEFWTDGSAYGQRLAVALRAQLTAFTAPVEGRAICALMGSHVAVADEIRRRAQPGALYLVADDCVVEEFDALLTGTAVITLCPHATPDFGECVRLALEHVAAAGALGSTVTEYLNGHADFECRQYRQADYTIVRRHYPRFA
ncbi:ABC transporter substrate-binding protein [Pseudomonas atagonensis]|uniref:ABC transporter substrate-binding protein n=1 Tax=Pseudomonas atagonensis TaxID=2609964 RepID=UPI00140C8406|nr:ABC transporter substrate-binding protein [Pseudomonas atagonensis]